MRLPKLLASFFLEQKQKNNKTRKKRERTSKLQRVFNDFRAACDEGGRSNFDAPNDCELVLLGREGAVRGR